MRRLLESGPDRARAGQLRRRSRSERILAGLLEERGHEDGEQT
jgi:hypothetical protein